MVERNQHDRVKEEESGKERDRDGGMKRDSKQVFSCAMHNEERQTAHKRPTNEVQVIYIYIRTK